MIARIRLALVLALTELDLGRAFSAGTRQSDHAIRLPCGHLVANAQEELTSAVSRRQVQSFDPIARYQA